MKIHVLSGDSLLEPFGELDLEGEVAVFRECLADGPLDSPDLDGFFSLRSAFLTSVEDAGFYESSVRPEIEKILDAPADAEIFLWFEHELFCQVNLWFLLHNLIDRDSLWFVGPPAEPFKNRFGGWAPLGTEELSVCFEERLHIEEEDRELGSVLWQAFAAMDSDRLKELGARESPIFKFLPEVSQAAAEIDNRPRRTVQKLVEEGTESFGDVFRAFSEQERVYGFGDLQVKRIWDSLTATE
ncbi:MAG: hypothetical protein IPM63_01360 [Acidobacteriota bacterium]|nr:MAG: hypothetical protein IPM63_01360 [Acidobacteriota bacterium]